jgi:signal transduction histidine kinase
LSLVSALIFVFPPLINFLVLYLDSKQRKLEAMIAYFALYPFFTNLAYIDSFSLGTELFFVLYGILSVFFLQQAMHIVFCIAFNMVNYLMLIVMLKRYQTPHDDNHPFFFLLNHVVAVAIIFYSLYQIKKENAGYQASILEKNNELLLINEEVKKQKEEIAEKAQLLEEQAIRLNKIDAFKNRLFSIVSHDLKAPLHALKNLFSAIKQEELPAEEIVELVPDVIKDLNYATWLTENLLNWAKTQMHAESMHPHNINVEALLNEVMQQQRLQAELKNITIHKAIEKDLFIYADSDMVKLVVRNVLSNAIKFTPEGGRVTIGTNAIHTYVEIFIEDNGDGMDEEALNKINNNDYFTTRGTANEQGTGLGLMLCKEFLEKNKGQLHIESEKGKGSVFSFTLPRTNN